MKALYLNYIHVMKKRIQRLEKFALNNHLCMDDKYRINELLNEYHCKMFYAAQKLAGL